MFGLPLYGPVIKFSDGYQNKRLVIKKNENTDSYQQKRTVIKKFDNQRNGYLVIKNLITGFRIWGTPVIKRVRVSTSLTEDVTYRYLACGYDS